MERNTEIKFCSIALIFFALLAEDAGLLVCLMQNFTTINRKFLKIGAHL